MLSEYEISDQIAKPGFMVNYLVWHQHGEVQATTANESYRNDDEDQMDDIIADIDKEYDLGSGDQHPPSEVQNFDRLLVASDEKVHECTDLTALQAVTHLMAMKSKCNFTNQCYNDIMKLIIYLIPMKHNISNDLYQSKNIVSGLGMNYETTDVCEKIAYCSRRSTRMISNVYIAVGPDT
jgi:hypothetical protein